MPKNGTFTTHVGPGDHDDLLAVGIEVDVVGNIAFANGQTLFDDRMPAFFDAELMAVGECWQAIVLRKRHFGKGEKAVELCEELRIFLNRANEVCHGKNELLVDLLFDFENFLFCAEDFLLVFFELFSDVALR